MSQTILFLDIDGVLNHRHTVRVPGMPFTCDPVNVRCLNTLIAQSGAGIIITSDWRRWLAWEDLCAVLGAFGVCGPFIGRTPVVLQDYPLSPRPPRGHEVDVWLQQQRFTAPYLILDDRGDLEPHLHRLIQTHPDTGLMEEHIERAMRLLSGATEPLVETKSSSLWQNVRDEEL